MDFTVAIDFGSSFSGWAVASSDGALHVNTNWEFTSADKNRTCILYNQQQTPLAWGFAAQKMYLKRDHDKDNQRLYLIENFKMLLTRNEDAEKEAVPSAVDPSEAPSAIKSGVSAEPPAETYQFVISFSSQGRRWNLQTVITDLLRLMKVDIFKYLHEKTDQLDEKKIRWTITVPGKPAALFQLEVLQFQVNVRSFSHLE